MFIPKIIVIQFRPIFTNKLIAQQTKKTPCKLTGVIVLTLPQAPGVIYHRGGFC